MADQRRPGAALVQPVNDSDPYGVAPAPTPARSEVPTDTERLDWIEANQACFGHHKATGRWYSRAGRSFWNVREAIDAAMRGR